MERRWIVVCTVVRPPTRSRDKEGKADWGSRRTNVRRTFVYEHRSDIASWRNENGPRGVVLIL